MCNSNLYVRNLQKWGHTGLVWDNSGGTKSFTILEQNFDSKANSPAKLREDDYTGLTHFIVPDFADDSVDLTDIKEVQNLNVNLKVQSS